MGMPSWGTEPRVSGSQGKTASRNTVLKLSSSTEVYKYLTEPDYDPNFVTSSEKNCDAGLLACALTIVLVMMYVELFRRRFRPWQCGKRPRPPQEECFHDPIDLYLSRVLVGIMVVTGCEARLL
jgi:hypothetical protein